MITKIMQMDAKMAYDLLPKQKTLEEFEEDALKYNEQFIGGQESRYASEDFIEGAKWQAERSYSEEDMREMYNKSCGLIRLSLLDDQTENNNRFKNLLEQFKKK